MIKKPNFFILGAPKCGTTSLAYWLSQHPNIFMSDIKEPHHFNTDGLQNISDRDEYEALFDEVSSQHSIVGEASTHYLYSREAVPNILKYNRQSKFLVCLRNPVEMVQALHGERLSQGRETIKSFREAWEAQEDRRQGENIPSTIKNDPERLQYGEYCKLGKQLQRFLSMVDHQKVHMVLLDDMKKDKEKVYTDILSFLDLPSIINTDFPILNTSKVALFPTINKWVKDLARLKRRLGINIGFNIEKKIKGLLNVRRPRKKISNKLQKDLKSYFEQDIKLIERILNRDLEKWVS